MLFRLRLVLPSSGAQNGQEPVAGLFVFGPDAIEHRRHLRIHLRFGNPLARLAQDVVPAAPVVYESFAAKLCLLALALASYPSYRVAAGWHVISSPPYLSSWLR